MADSDWEDVPKKKSADAATATADEWEDVSPLAPRTSTVAATEENLPGLTPRLRAAVKSGVATMAPPTQFERERPQMPTWYGFTPGNVLSGAWRGAKGLVGSALQGAYDVGLGQVNPETGEIEHGAGGLIGLNTKGEFAPIERAKALGQKYITDPAVEQWNKAKEQSGQDHMLGAIGHAGAAALPLAGPWAASLGERAGTGDIGGATGEALGTLAAGELMAHPTAIGKGIKAAGGKVAETLHNPLNIGLSGEELITKSVRPRARATSWEQAIQSPGVQRAIAEYHADTPITSMTEFTDAIPEIKDTLWKEKVQPALDRQGPRAVDMKPVGEQIRAPITPEMREFHPEKVQGLEDLATKLERARTVEEADRLQKYANAQLESYYNKYPTGRRSAFATNPETMEWELARRGVRDQLLKTLEDAGETEIGDARKDYGNLTTIQKELERKVNVNARKSTMSLSRILGLISSVPTHGIGLVAGEVAHHFAQPDVLIRQGIKRLNPPEAPPFTAPQPFVPPTPIQQIPRMTGEQVPLNLPPTEAELFNIQQTPHVGAPLGPIQGPPSITPIRGGGLEPTGTLEPIGGTRPEGILPAIGQQDLKSVAQNYLESVGGQGPEVELPRKGSKINASGESSASQEAISRIASEKAAGAKRMRIDTRSGKETPLHGVEAVDAKPGPYDEILIRDKNGNETTLDRGDRALPRHPKKPAA